MKLERGYHFHLALFGIMPLMNVLVLVLVVPSSTMKFPLSRGLSAFAPMRIASPAFSAAPPKKEEVEDPNAPVSYFKRGRPIFWANCQGCHQPAKAKGG